MSLKNRVGELLEAPDFEKALPELKALDCKKVVSVLYAHLCQKDETIKWRAVTAMGVMVAQLAEEDVESARTIMRRLMWSLNDESGGIGWGASESMAEIMANNDGLAEEFSHILVSYIMPDGNYLEFGPLLRGAVWGIGRLAEKRPDLLTESKQYLVPLLESKDERLTALARRALTKIEVDAGGGAGA